MRRAGQRPPNAVDRARTRLHERIDDASEVAEELLTKFKRSVEEESKEAALDMVYGNGLTEFLCFDNDVFLDIGDAISGTEPTAPKVPANVDVQGDSVTARFEDVFSCASGGHIYVCGVTASFRPGTDEVDYDISLERERRDGYMERYDPKWGWHRTGEEEIHAMVRRMTEEAAKGTDPAAAKAAKRYIYDELSDEVIDAFLEQQGGPGAAGKAAVAETAAILAGMVLRNAGRRS